MSSDLPYDVLLRDDDTSFFTSPGAIERLYHDLWAKGPVTLAVIPYVHGSPQPFVPESHRHTAKEYALGDNRDLVGFLRDGLASRRLAVALHGCTHEDLGGRPEFADGDDLAERLRRGRAHLEDTLGVRITAFVPPHNRLSLHGYRAVRSAALNLLNLPSVRAVSRPPAWWVVRTMAARAWYRGVWHCEVPYPVHAPDGHWELGCQPLTPRTRLDGLYAAQRLCAARGWTLGLNTHYWEADAPLEGRTVRDEVRALFVMIEEQGPVRLVSPDQVFVPQSSRARFAHRVPRGQERLPSPRTERDEDDLMSCGR